MRYIIEDYKCLLNTCYKYLGFKFIKDSKVFFSNLKLILKTVAFMLVSSLLN
jgi:hypothetical protein